MSTTEFTAYVNPEGIANRALQYCGATRIVTLQDNDKGAAEIADCYDKLRRTELRRNLWTFSVRRAVLYPVNTLTFNNGFANAPLPTLLYVPATWVATKQYAFGAIVAYSGKVWVNGASSSIGDIPGSDAAQNWDTYFGSMCVQPWTDPTVPANLNFELGYFVGDLVYVGQQSFVSLDNSNVSSPMVPTAWLSTSTYSVGQAVQDSDGFLWKSAVPNNTNQRPGSYDDWSSSPTYVPGALVIGSDGVLYQSLVSNSNHNPAAGASPTQWLASGAPGSWPLWNATITYAKNQFISGTDGQVYQSVQAGNLNNQPVGSTYNPNTPSSNWWVKIGVTVPWISNFASPATSLNWLGLDGVLDNININYPIGTGPSIQTQTKNIFMLPNGFLRHAPQQPKAGSTSFLGAPTGLMYSDWEMDGNYIVSQSPYPIIFRFGADITNVGKMDDMFCEALGARIALAVVETLTQSGSKMANIERDYKKFVDDARTVNGIEQGPTEPPEDDYITCRI